MGQPFALSKHSCNLLFVLFIQAKTPNRAVENGVFHYPVGPFVFRVTAAFAAKAAVTLKTNGPSFAISLI